MSEKTKEQAEKPENRPEASEGEIQEIKQSIAKIEERVLVFDPSSIEELKELNKRMEKMENATRSKTTKDEKGQSGREARRPFFRSRRDRKA